MVDHSIDLSIIRGPNLDNNSDGLAQVKLEALDFGAPQGGPNPPSAFRTVEVSLYSSTDNPFDTDDRLLEKRTFRFPVRHGQAVGSIKTLQRAPTVTRLWRGPPSGFSPWNFRERPG